MEIPLRSSHLASASHSGTTLTIRFKTGHTYQYFGVPATTFNGLIRTQSPGSFFAKQVKPFYKFKKLGT